ncbi:hypothetical protein PQO01_03900 [Lentisphaera marina]|uniref:hypothetical protein n=1 Tax=Lentisphaera marina TaxID=1111041 RepID=UPI0023665002|nr:hypothetical protein [Lentisphaera marina]MDD7984094.1 hypothetical protein [Lentisphaera marina]
MKKFLFALIFISLSSSLSAKDLEWTIPNTWERSSEKKAMRLATLLVKADNSLAIAVSRFPGDVGGELANVNRWRRQIGLAPVNAANLQEGLEVIESAAGKAKLLDISNGDKQMLAVMFPHQGSTYFFKLTGSKDKVSKEKESLIKLVKSFK